MRHYCFSSALRPEVQRARRAPGAPLSHLVIHSEDIYRPLGKRDYTSPDNANVALDQMTSARA